jgi:hypothetical protein
MGVFQNKWKIIFKVLIMSEKDFRLEARIGEKWQKEARKKGFDRTKRGGFRTISHIERRKS